MSRRIVNPKTWKWKIPLTHGLVTLVDEDVFKMFSKFDWHASSGTERNGKRLWYAARTATKIEKELGLPRCILLHRVLMGFPTALVVDHINDDSLDNRRANLQALTVQENFAKKRALKMPLVRRRHVLGTSWKDWQPVAA